MDPAPPGPFPQEHPWFIWGCQSQREAKGNANALAVPLQGFAPCEMHRFDLSALITEGIPRGHSNLPEQSGNIHSAKLERKSLEILILGSLWCEEGCRLLPFQSQLSVPLVLSILHCPAAAGPGHSVCSGHTESPLPGKPNFLLPGGVKHHHEKQSLAVVSQLFCLFSFSLTAQGNPSSRAEPGVLTQKFLLQQSPPSSW